MPQDGGMAAPTCDARSLQAGALRLPLPLNPCNQDLLASWLPAAPAQRLGKAQGHHPQGPVDHAMSHFAKLCP